MNSDKGRIKGKIKYMTKDGEKDRFLAGFCTLFLMIALVMISATAGCTGTNDKNIMAEATLQEGNDIPVIPQKTEEMVQTFSMNDVIAIDLVSMYQDVQNKNPLAFDYEIMPTRYIGLSDEGDYEFEGTISNFCKGGDQSNYIGVLFTEKDDESGTGYHEWIHKGLKFNSFGGEDDQNIIFKFTVDKEDIPKEKTFIMTGYDLYQI
ncbi:MAG: hypothetical protein JXN62_07395 [Bacteroidales bacterium]|nr:hypothetical protein [Bacteroidales bacterium]